MFESTSILSVTGFTFFLLIIAIGYCAVELIGGAKYIYRPIFDRYENNLFDRIVHYVIAGLVINASVILLLANTGKLQHIFDLANGAGKVADALYKGSEAFSVQVILFACTYFGIIFGIMMLINVIWWLFRASEDMACWLAQKTGSAK